MGYSATHGRYVALTIPSSLASGATHTDFPVCFTTANLPSEMFDADGTYPAKSDGSDIRFSSDSAGDTPMNVEVERFGIDNNPANGYAEIWVRIPSFSHTVDTTVYCWWNDPDASLPAANDADEGSQGVWDSNFKGVWHLSEAVNNDADGYKDATANAAHMTGTSMAISAPAGAWAGSVAAEFDGTADYMGRGALFSAYPISFSAWVYPDSEADGTYHVVGEKDYQTSWDEMNTLWLLGNTANDPVWAYSRNPTELYSEKTDFAATTWQHVAATFNTASRIAYLNGAGGTEQTTSDAYSATPSHFSVGGMFISWSLYSDFCFDGRIDEVRASSSIRSAAWLAAEYAVINSIGSITPGTPGSPGGGGITVVPVFGGRSARRLGAPTFGGRAVRRVA